jgi:hypothetical protein
VLSGYETGLWRWFPLVVAICIERNCDSYTSLYKNVYIISFFAVLDLLLERNRPSLAIHLAKGPAILIKPP